MSDRLADAFDFQGRLGRGGRRRLELKLGVILVLAVMTPIALLIAGVPRALAWIPFLALPPAGVAFLAASVRRLHDVGLSAGMEFVRGFGFLIIVLGPLAAAILMPDLPPPYGWVLVGFPIAALIVASFRNLTGGRPEWGPGDPGPNRFGPPPE
jgi:uncharacterized membrane protein YhaH (DUF805 family)